jgi:hypothetical protein
MTEYFSLIGDEATDVSTHEQVGLSDTRKLTLPGLFWKKVNFYLIVTLIRLHSNTRHRRDH